MGAELNLFSNILLIGIAQGIFLALALLNTQGGNVISQRILATITLIFSFDLIGEFLYRADFYHKFPWIIWIDDPLEFLYGPLLIFYIHALTAPGEFKLTHSKWPHFLAFILAILLSAPFYALDSVSKIQFVYQNTFYQDSVYLGLAYFGQLALVVLFIIQTGFYLIWGGKTLFEHAQKIRTKFSYTERVNLTWLRNIFIFFSVLYLLFIVNFITYELFSVGEIISQLLYLLTIAMFYILAFLGLRQPTIFSNIQSDANDSNNKYKSSALNTEMSLLLLEELKAYMESEKPYLDSKLTLPQLALQLKISTNYLSQIINEQLAINFFDFINGYRIDEAKQYLSRPNKSNLLTIAYDSGFNSKSAFYMAFKKKTQMTPSQYKKSLAIE